MALAIFGITNNGLNLAATLFLLMLVVLWLALIVYTYLDARRRISDPFLVACATVASFFPYIGTVVYAIVRPPEYLEDAHERELEIKAAELRVRQLRDQTCPNCEYPVEKNFLRCPNCQRRLKDPCPTCGKPVDPRWGLCPYCETRSRRRRETAPPQKRERRPEGERDGPSLRAASRAGPIRGASREAPPKRQPRAPQKSAGERRQEALPRTPPGKSRPAAAPAEGARQPQPRAKEPQP